MKTYQEFVSEALMARPSLVSASLNRPRPAAVQNAQKNIVKRPVPATKPVNNTAPAAAAGTPRTAPTATATPTAAAGTKRPSLMQQAQELRAMRMRSMQRQGNTAGASAIRKTLPTAVAGASDQRAQQLNRVRNQARSATIANARGGQGMMRRSPVVQQQRPVVQQRPVPTATAGTGTAATPAPRPAVQQRPVVQQQTTPAPRPAVQQQRPATAGTPQKPRVGDKATDPEALKAIELEREIGRTGRMPTNVKPKFRDEDLFTGQKLNPNTGKPVQQQPKFRDEDLFTGQKLNPNTGKPVQQQNNKGLVNVKTDAGVTTGVDPSTGEKRLIQGRSPQQTQRIKSALDISGSTAAPAAAGTGTNTSELSDDMIGKAFAARKATMMRGDGGEYSNMGKTPEEFRSKFNSLPPNRQRAILRRLAQ